MKDEKINIFRGGKALRTTRRQLTGNIVGDAFFFVYKKGVSGFCVNFEEFPINQALYKCLPNTFVLYFS